MPISSVASDYSPTVRFTALVHVTDSVRVRVERTRVLAPGEVFEGMGPISGALRMQAMIVTAADSTARDASAEAGAARNGVHKRWTERSSSVAQPLVDSLYMGIPRAVSPLEFSLALPQGVAARESWLVFRISGASIGTPVRLADGDVRPAVIDSGGVRVFACAAHNLDGRLDRIRSEQLATAYNAWC
jgi:hypothetical protein